MGLAETDKDAIVHSKCKEHSVVSAFTRKTLLKDLFIPKESDAIVTVTADILVRAVQR